MPDANAAASAPATWIPVATLMLGFFTSSVSTWLSSYLTAKRERDTRREERQQSRAERHAQFQRETLFALQDAVFDLMKLNSDIDLENVKAARASGKWGATQLSPQLNEDTAVANRRVSMLVVRVHDDRVREAVLALRDATTWIGINLDERAQKQALATATEHYAEMTTRVGELLRTL